MNAPPPDLSPVLDFVARHAGLALGARRETAEAGILRAMGRARAADPEEYVARLSQDADALDDLLAELTVGETYFFREPAQFEFIRRTVLPGLRERGRGVRAWSAGCASGEEAYSLAVLLEQEGLGEQGYLIATDVCRAALARARAAVYRPWSLRGEGAEAMRPFLTHVGADYRVAEGIVQRVAFHLHNLARDAYPSFVTGIWGVDLILCRNVLIYFDRETIRRVARGLFESLADDGWLITASSDPPLADEAPFEVVTTDAGLFYRRAAPARHTAAEPGVDPVATGGAPVSPPPAVTVSEPPETDEAARRAARHRQADAVPSRVIDAAVLADARTALAAGDYAQAAELMADFGPDAEAAAVRVRALANLDADRAERECAAAAERHPLAAELAYLHAVLLVNAGHDADASRVLKRVLYLDGGLAAAHFVLGSVLQRLGDVAGARRAYRNARDLCAARPPEEAVALADGDEAGPLADAAAAEIALLDAERGRAS